MGTSMTYLRTTFHMPNRNGSGHAVAWLKHYATSRKAAGSIPDEVTGIFN
jgi:hypothetical protein